MAISPERSCSVPVIVRAKLESPVRALAVHDVGCKKATSGGVSDDDQHHAQRPPKQACSQDGGSITPCTTDLSGVPAPGACRPACGLLLPRLRAGRLPSQASTGTHAGFFRHVVLQAGPSLGMRDGPLPRPGASGVTPVWCPSCHRAQCWRSRRMNPCGLQLCGPVSPGGRDG
jgi:hypothetical protein